MQYNKISQNKEAVHDKRIKYIKNGDNTLLYFLNGYMGS